MVYSHVVLIVHKYIRLLKLDPSPPVSTSSSRMLLCVITRATVLNTKTTKKKPTNQTTNHINTRNSATARNTTVRLMEAEPPAQLDSAAIAMPHRSQIANNACEQACCEARNCTHWLSTASAPKGQTAIHTDANSVCSGPLDSQTASTRLQANQVSVSAEASAAGRHVPSPIPQLHIL